MDQNSVPSPPAESNARLALRAFIRFGLLLGLCTVAGYYGYWNAWLFLGVTLVVLAINLTVLKLRNPALLRERLKPDRPTKSWDRTFMIVGGIASFSILIVAPADFFLHLGPPVPTWAIALGAVLFIGGDAIVAWAMGENPFLERTVRIQEERKHTVITTGPYRFVRHPMYTGMLIMMAGWPLVLGSWWTFAPVILFGITLVIRTGLEDRTLQEELPGYREYAQKTRFRLLPGLW